MGHCEDCCFWLREEVVARPGMYCRGECTEARVGQAWQDTTRDGAGAGWGRIRVITGERFGCIHFSPRALTPEQ